MNQVKPSHLNPGLIILLIRYRNLTEKRWYVCMNIKKSIISIILGWLSIAAAFYPISIDSAYDASIHWGIILCILCGMTFGTKYAVLSCTVGLGMFFPFIVWRDYGYANMVTSIFTLIWITCISISNKYIKEKMLPFFSIYILQAIFVIIYLLFNTSLIKAAIKLNPPFFKGHYLATYLPDNILSVNAILFAEITTLMLLSTDILLSTHLFNRILKQPKTAHNNYSLPIILITGIIIVMFSVVTTSSENSMSAISFSVNSYKSNIGNIELNLLKSTLVIFIADFLIHFIEYKNELNYKERLSTNRYLNIFRNILDIYIEFTPDYVINSVSPSAQKVFNCTTDNLVGKNITDFFIDNHYKEEFKNCTEEKSDASDREFHIQLNDGKLVWLLASRIAPLDENNMIFIARDITERKKRQEEQEEMSQLQNAILESSDDIIFCLNNGKIISQNKSASKFFMKKCGTQTPKKFKAIFSDDENIEWKNFIKQTIKKDEYNTEYFDQSTGKYYEIRFKKIQYGAGNVDISVFAKDITEVKARENQTQMINEELEYRVLDRTKEMTRAYNELENFCAIVAHEFKSPVRAISLYNNMIKQDLENNDLATDDIKEAVNSIHDYCENSLDMIQNLLEYSKIKSKKITHQQLNMKMIIKNCLRELRVINSNLDIRVSIDEIPNIIGDEFLMRHVVYNILSNSIKYSSTKEYIKINVTYLSEKNEHILSFSDNGVGFDMTGSDNIFNIFKRMHTNDEFKGTGVGLATVKNIVEKHGGTVFAKAELDKGCVIVISLPK